MTTVWRIAALDNPDFYYLQPTREEAERCVGTANRHLYGPVTSEERSDVVFVVVRAGWADEGGGEVVSIHRTHAGAMAATEVRNGERDTVEIREVVE